MEKVNIQAIGTFINDNYHIIINDLNLTDITPNSVLNSSVINNICKYPIKVSKVASFNKHYDYEYDTQTIVPQFPVIDINCTPIKSISTITSYSFESMNNINIYGYQIIDKSFANYYQIMIKTFNNIIKSFNFDTVFYVNFVNFDTVNKIGWYIDFEYHISSSLKKYYQNAFDYLKKDCKIYFDKNKSYLFLDNNHNEIIIYNNNIIYRFNNIDIKKVDPLLQKYVPSTVNCFEEFIINEFEDKPIYKPINYDEPEYITDDDDYEKDYYY